MLATDLRYALDPVAFAREALGFKPDAKQEAVLRWRGKRLLLNWSRQTGKSTTTAVLALHHAMYTPGALALLVSPSLRQSSELFRKVADLLGRLEAPPALVEDNRLSMALANHSRVVSLPSSEATIRGFSGATLIIEDEASRVSDDLYRAVRPMLATSAGRLILMSTPFGKRGHYFEEWANGGPVWQRMEYQAADCPRISAEFLAEERASMGEWWFAQEYTCQFRETVDSVFPYDLVMAAISNDVKPIFEGGDW